MRCRRVNNPDLPSPRAYRKYCNQKSRAVALGRIGQAEPVVAFAEHPSRALRIASVVALRRMGDPGVAAFLSDEDEFIVTEAARAINDDRSIPDAGDFDA
jgi:hypothetical protein